MSAEVKVTGATELLRDIGKWPDSLETAIAREMRTEVDGLIVHMRGRARAVTGAAEIAVDSLALSTAGSTLTLKAGGRGGLASTLTPGGEYGGRKRGKRSYVGRSPKGTPYVMRRRATQQFKPHLGNRGYWFWPTVREDLKGVNQRIRKIIDKVIAP